MYRENYQPGLRSSFVFNRQNENNYKKLKPYENNLKKNPETLRSGVM